MRQLRISNRIMQLNGAVEQDSGCISIFTNSNKRGFRKK
ncbi:hypothetical protein ASZ90_012827 [hydrocarbon metagenome]|uniref:Uncharacterized protein n=1 Tax=hydrocarbon metagenome TaxID=938273 RepID=A0A0W8FA60_9ZZZZ